jgi:hypothetical protein
MFELPTRSNREAGLAAFAEELQNLDKQIGFKVSARGWCYQLEQFRLINKDQFDKVENIINTCREKGYLPVDFTAEEEGRRFSGVEEATEETPKQFLARYLKAALKCEDWYTPDWWTGESYYIQMLVEKIDLKTLFEPICKRYHIPIATSKGWSSMLQRAEYAKRFQEAEDNGLECVLLYCGDHDPDGLRISEFIRKNLDDLKNIVWSDGTGGYDPANLTIDRFGLNYEFIITNNLTWIDNLITGSKKNLASPSHPNHFMPYVQQYLSTVGERKCEANALVVRPRESREMVNRVIVNYLGDDALDRFNKRSQKIRDELTEFRASTGLIAKINEIIRLTE